MLHGLCYEQWAIFYFHESNQTSKFYHDGATEIKKGTFCDAAVLFNKHYQIAGYYAESWFLDLHIGSWRAFQSIPIVLLCQYIPDCK